MSLIDRSFVELLAAFRSPAPTPGGGSASAAAGALGASLLAMVAAMPSRRAPSEEDVERLRAAGERCAAIGDRLAALVHEDSAAYDQVVSAYRLPKGSDEEKASRSARIQEALERAAATPLSTMRACLDASEQAVIAAELGNPNAASDVGVALELLGAALRGAALNVEINLASVKDPDRVASLRDEMSTVGFEFDRAVSAAKGYLG